MGHFSDWLTDTSIKNNWGIEVNRLIGRIVDAHLLCEVRVEEHARNLACIHARRLEQGGMQNEPAPHEPTWKRAHDERYTKPRDSAWLATARRTVEMEVGSEGSVQLGIRRRREAANASTCKTLLK